MKIGGFVAAFVLFFGIQSASASVVLDFAGLDNVFFQDGPLNYYAGGTSIEGNGPGPNYGVTFSDNAFSCDTCLGLAAPPPPGNFLIFSDPILPGGPPSGPSIMNVAGGFDSEFSLYYSNTYFGPVSVNIYDGLNGTGTQLASLLLDLTPDPSTDPACGDALLCPFVLASVNFSGTAHSVDFTAADNNLAFADITLGAASVPATSVPEPLTLSLLGAGLGGILMARRRKAARRDQGCFPRP